MENPFDLIIHHATLKSAENTVIEKYQDNLSRICNQRMERKRFFELYERITDYHKPRRLL